MMKEGAKVGMRWEGFLNVGSVIIRVTRPGQFPMSAVLLTPLRLHCIGEKTDLDYE